MTANEPFVYKFKAHQITAQDILRVLIELPDRLRKLPVYFMVTAGDSITSISEAVVTEYGELYNSVTELLEDEGVDNEEELECEFRKVLIVE